MEILIVCWKTQLELLFASFYYLHTLALMKEWEILVLSTDSVKTYV